MQKHAQDGHRQAVELFRRETTRVKSIAFHPTLPVLITANHCGAIHIWGYHYGQVTATFTEHTGSVRCVRFHPAGALFATGGDDHVVRVWDFRSREVVQRLAGHTDFVRSVDFHPTQPWVISASDDCTVRIWNYNTGEQLCASTGHHHYVMAALFVDSTHFVTASLDHSIVFWSCANLFEKTRRLMVPDAVAMQTVEAHVRGVNTLFFRDGVLYSGADDREIKRWRVSEAGLQLENTFFVHEGNVTAVCELAGRCVGVAEDGTLSLCEGRRTERVDVGARLWAVAARGDLLAVGTDNGLVVYRWVLPLLGAAPWAVRGGALLRCAGVDAGADAEPRLEEVRGYVVAAGCRFVAPLQRARVLVQYARTYDIVEDGRKIAGGAGAYAEGADGTEYRLQGGVLTAGAEREPAVADGEYLHAVEGGVLVCGRTALRMFATGGWASPHVYSCPFEIVEVVVGPRYVAVFGRDRLVLLTHLLQHVAHIDERVELFGGFFVDEELLIYATARQLRFYLHGAGLLQSLERPVRPLCLAGEAVVAVGADGAECLPVVLAEVAFRRAVARGASAEELRALLEEERLPGLSPLHYMVARGCGEAALPFVKAPRDRFAILRSSGRFEEAYALCGERWMYEELAEAALRGGCADVAERCLKELSDARGLFFLFVATKQLAKLETLRGTEAWPMACLVLENPAILPALPRSEEKAVRGADVHTPARAVTSRQAKGSSGTSATAQVSADGGAKTDASASATDKTIRTDTQVASAISKLTLKGAEAEERSTEDVSEPAGELPVAPHTLPIDTVCLAAQPLPTESPTALLAQGLELTTAGRFPKAVIAFRAALMCVAAEMRDIAANASAGALEKACAHAEALRRKLGTYLWGLHVEIERRRLAGAADTPAAVATTLKLAVFFADLPLEEQHCTLARGLAMAACAKHGNLATAKRFAAQLPASAKTQRVLEDARDSDVHALPAGDVCYDTLAVEAHSQVCGLCFVRSSGADEQCPACLVGIVR